MNKLIALVFFLLTFGQLFGQEKQCHCDKDTLMNFGTSNCNTIVLSNKSKLYWQYNCNKIWLTLENTSGKKIVLDQVPVEFYAYTYRLGFHLVKEFEKTILFRSGCPANGSCIYLLIDKSSGKKIKEFGQLICIDTEIRKESKYQFNFVVYPDKKYKNLIIDYINIKKKLIVPFDFQKNDLLAVIPEYSFNKMKLDNEILTLFYTNTVNKELNLKINLNDKKYSH